MNCRVLAGKGQIKEGSVGARQTHKASFPFGLSKLIHMLISVVTIPTETLISVSGALL